ncbi:MAG: glutathione S-transferase [Pseudomonadota bacterium]
MARYRLHCLDVSGNAYKAALTLSLLGADWEAALVDWFAGQHRSPAYLALNPMGEIPTVELPDGRALSQSGAILSHLARTFGRLDGETEAERSEVLRWMFWDNHKLSAALAAERYQKAFSPAAARDAAATAQAEATRRAACALLEARLSAQDFVALAGRATVADLSCYGYLHWLEHTGDRGADWPAIDAWRARVRALEGWAAPEALMPAGSGRALI